MEQYVLNLETDSPNIEEQKNRIIEENEDATSSVVPPPDIVAFNEQRSCADLYRMYIKNQIDINPDFQRGEVWSNKSQTLFIDSLIKQLPIPSMCISLDIKTQKRFVIDGLQRITSIIKFLNTSEKWKLSKTPAVDERLSGKSNTEIKEKNESLFEILENVTIPITVLRCNYDDENHMKYLFQIFYRLNSGGNKLYNQEIRNCIFQGSFNTLLKELARSNEWLGFAGTTLNKVEKARFNNEERILRFFSFSECFDKYQGKLAIFLNDYMNSYKNAPEETIASFRDLFYKTLSIANKIGAKISSKNVADAVLVGIAKNIDSLLNVDSNTVNRKYQDLLLEDEFSDEALSEGLGATEKVQARIKKAIRVFSL